jgi:serine/threonine protein phosphatase 1
MKTLAIGDVHGCLDQLKALIAAYEKNFPGEETRYVFIGDYIDRGPDSKGVLDFSRRMKEKGETIRLMGNHEKMLWEAYFGDTHSQYQWTASYGDTMDSFGVQEIYDIPRSYIEEMMNLPYFFNDGLRTFVHAGIQRSLRLSMDTQNKDYMVWARDEFMMDMRPNGGFVVHGHTPLRSDWPDLHHNRLNLDTACVFGGVLTGAVFNDVDNKPTHFINHHGLVVEVSNKLTLRDLLQNNA